MKKKKRTIAKVEEKQNLLNVSDIPNLKVIPIDTRKFVQFDFDFTSPDSKVVIPKILPEQIENAIVKVNIRIRQEDIHKINVRELEEMIRSHAFYLRPIVPSIQKQKVARIQKLTTDLNPIDAVKIWIIEKGIKNPDEVLKIAEEVMRNE